jgi:hypothetical protein
MVAKEIILKKVEVELAKYAEQLGFEIILDPEYCQEYSEFMICAYDSKEYLVNNNFSYALVGNLPFVADVVTGNIYLLIERDCDFDNSTFSDLLTRGALKKVE